MEPRLSKCIAKEEMQMTLKRFRLPLIVLLGAMVLVANPGAEAGMKYLAAGSVDFKAILQNPPANDSAQTRKEIDEILEFQASRTPEDVARVRSEMGISQALFNEVIKQGFDFKAHPVTDAFLTQVQADTQAIIDEAKAHWARPRPYNVDPAVQPAADRPGNPSYPSGHAAIGRMFGIVLQQLFPDKKSKLMARGDEIGLDRVIAGVHYRSDVVAGRKLGDAIAAKLLKSKAFQTDLAAAKKELSAKK
jgi:acid phosphatase (class A)